MRRILLEEKLPVQMFLKMEEPQHGMTLEQAFDRARNTVNTLCEQIMQKKQQAATNVNRSLVSYVNEHLHDPDLSLNLLSDHFGVSNASVSRIFKIRWDKISTTISQKSGWQKPRNCWC